MRPCQKSHTVFLQFFHSGVKHEDLRILSKLGVCKSPDMIVQFQRKMGECCESKVGHWKREIEKAKVASLLLNEVRVKQVGNHRDDVMRVNIDFSEETIRKYDFFELVAFQFCQEHINRFSGEQDIITGQEFHRRKMSAHALLKMTRDSCIKRVDRFCTKYRLASLKFRGPLEV